MMMRTTKRKNSMRRMMVDQIKGTIQLEAYSIGFEPNMSRRSRQGKNGKRK